MSNKLNVLFVCVQNSARSQIAEGFFRKYANGRIMCVSAGTVPADTINPDAVGVMRELGIDISSNKPKILTSEMINRASIIINMGCMDNNSCPVALLKSSKIMQDWGIEDPHGKSIAKMREIRDQIERKVLDLIRQTEN
ncbi:MAG: low molecular weight phosphatase family protein [Nitrososphaerales archaeon]